jgi:UDP-N-acetylmuramate--alanine ligase
MTHVHLIGIGGSGLSAIARFLLESGYTVSGSDRVLSPLAAELKTSGATVTEGHAAENVTGADWVVRSSAIPDDNPEVRAAQSAGIPVYKRADFLGQLMQMKIGIAVAGTHGKTTTSAMIAWMLSELGMDPSYIIGGTLVNTGVNAHAGDGLPFVIEADEYDRMFLGLKPLYAVVTNIEHDHPDIYPTEEDFQAAFVDFANLLPTSGALIASAEDKGSSALLAEMRRTNRRVIGYRVAESHRTESGEWMLALNVMPNRYGGYSFNAILRLHGALQYLSGGQLQVPGIHNVRNAMAALGVMGLMGQDIRHASQALSEFKGTGRRFEVRGEANGVTIVDDYAHHPTEIRATIEAARARYQNAHRLWAVWQPHTYSRVKTLFDDFPPAFAHADEVIVSEIYAAREPKEDFSAEKIVKIMKHPHAHFIAELADISDYLVAHLEPGDVLLVLSAGDADRVSGEVLARLQKSEASHE